RDVALFEIYALPRNSATEDSSAFAHSDGAEDLGGMPIGIYSANGRYSANCVALTKFESRPATCVEIACGQLASPLEPAKSDIDVGNQEKPRFWTGNATPVTYKQA